MDQINEFKVFKKEDSTINIRLCLGADGGDHNIKLFVGATERNSLSLRNLVSTTRLRTLGQMDSSTLEDFDNISLRVLDYV